MNTSQIPIVGAGESQQNNQTHNRNNQEGLQIIYILSRLINNNEHS